MVLKYKTSDDYQDWSDRVNKSEQDRARSEITRGADIETTLTEMGRRITEKLLHPVFVAIRASAHIEFDVKKSAEDYKEQMRNHTSRTSS